MAAAAAVVVGGLYYMNKKSTPQEWATSNTLPEAPLKDPKYGTNFYLKKGEAETRSNNVSEVEYMLSMCLLKGGKHFLGNVVIHFLLDHKTNDDPADGMLFIDYKGQAVRSFKVNGVYVTDERAYNE